jgi:hypothetical protein
MCKSFSDWARLFPKTFLMLCSVIFKSAKLEELSYTVALPTYRKQLAPYVKDGALDLRGIAFPYPEKPIHYANITSMLHDTFGGWLFNNDEWNSEFCDKFDKTAGEGVYCYSSEDVDMLIHQGDVVLDLGAWWGDFAAYAAKKGAAVYAFEPGANSIEMMRSMISMNKGFENLINIEPYGVGAKSDNAEFISGSFGAHFAVPERNGTERNGTERNGTERNKILFILFLSMTGQLTEISQSSILSKLTLRASSVICLRARSRFCVSLSRSYRFVLITAPTTRKFWKRSF